MQEEEVTTALWVLTPFRLIWDAYAYLKDRLRRRRDLKTMEAMERKLSESQRLDTENHINQE